MFVLQKASSKKIYEYELRTPNGGRSDRTLYNTRVIVVGVVAILISKIFLNGRTLRVYLTGLRRAERAQDIQEPRAHILVRR